MNPALIKGVGLKKNKVRGEDKKNSDYYGL